LAARAQRTRPSRDEKILTAWNGLAIAAFARAALVLDEPRYSRAAAAAADFALTHLHDGKTLLRRFSAGQSGIVAFAEDYSLLLHGLLELYQADLDERWLQAALRLQEEQLAHYMDPADGALFQAHAGADDLIVRAKAGYDGSLPTANSVAARNLLRLGEITGQARWLTAAERILRAFAGTLRERPLALTHLLLALDEWSGERIELVLAGRRGSAELTALLRAARTGFQPDLSIAHADAAAPTAGPLPALAGKTERGAATAYVCRRFACQAPTTQPDELLAQLGASLAD
jgi:uncharacterized protein YyaL (SSP411 family)